MARSTRRSGATRVDALMRAVDAVADALGDAGEANHRAFRDDATRIATALERTLTRDEDADAFAVLGVEHTVSMWTACVDAWTRAAETREATRATAATLRDVAAAARDAERAWAAKRARGVARELEEVELRHDARVRRGEDAARRARLVGRFRAEETAARDALGDAGEASAGVDVVARFRALEGEFLWREECVLRGERGASALEASVRAFEPDLRVGALALAVTRAARWRERVATFEGRRDDEFERRCDRDVIARMEAQHPALVAQYVMWMKDAALESSERAASSAVAAATTHLYDFLLALDADVYDAVFDAQGRANVLCASFNALHVLRSRASPSSPPPRLAADARALISRLVVRVDAERDAEIALHGDDWGQAAFAVVAARLASQRLLEVVA